MMSVQSSFEKASWDLLHRQVDFDYIDTEILVHAEIQNGKLTYRDREYEAVILPCARVLEDKAAQKLIAIASSGIPIFCCKELPQVSRESGVSTEYTAMFRQMCDAEENVYLAEEIEAFGALLDARFPARSRSVITKDNNPMILSHVRVTERGEKIIFIANMGKGAFCGDIAFYGEYATACLANCHTGDIVPIAATTDEVTTSVVLEIASGEGKFILLK